MTDTPQAFNLGTLPHPTLMHNPAAQLFEEDFLTKSIWSQRQDRTMAGCLTPNSAGA
jgi:hypothetical protein